MRILVTGALGHIGSRLIREIPSVFSDTEIILLDNLLTQRYCSLFHLPSSGRYRFLEADLLTTDLVSAFKGVDVVIHLAAITDAASSFGIRDQVEKVNLIGTEKVAQACLRAGCALFFSSTTSVYGPKGEVVDEACSIADLCPQSPYAESKLRAERYLQTLGEREGLRFVICRFGTIFGTSVGMRFHTAINKFCWRAVMGQPIMVWRTAFNQKRPYLDLGDAVESLKFVIQKDLFDRRVYNILTVNATVSAIVDIIRKYVPELTVQFVDAEIMNQLSYDVSNGRFKHLGFQFNGSLEKGISETIQLLRSANGLR